MIGTLDIEVQAKKPNVPLEPLYAYIESPSSIRIRNVPDKIGQWQLNRVYVKILYPDNTEKTCDCVCQ